MTFLDILRICWLVCVDVLAVFVFSLAVVYLLTWVFGHFDNLFVWIVWITAWSWFAWSPVHRHRLSPHDAHAYQWVLTGFVAMTALSLITDTVAHFQVFAITDVVHKAAFVPASHGTDHHRQWLGTDIRFDVMCILVPTLLGYLVAVRLRRLGFGSP